MTPDQSKKLAIIFEDIGTDDVKLLKSITVPPLTGFVTARIDLEDCHYGKACLHKYITIFQLLALV